MMMMIMMIVPHPLNNQPVSISLCLRLLLHFASSRRRREMYCGHARLCVCLSAAACPHYYTDPDVTWRSGRGCPLVVHYWADLQLVHGLRCCGNITQTRHVSEYMLSMPSLCIFTHRHSIAEQGGCFQRRLFVNLSVCQHDNFRTIKRRMMKFGS